MRALVYGRWNVEVIVAVLSRAGYEIDLVTNNPLPLPKHAVVRRFDCEDIPQIAVKAHELTKSVRYDYIQPADDITLRAIVGSAMPVDDKLVLLPVVKPEQIPQLGSKIEFARILENSAVPTPAYAVARNPAELKSATSQVGFPCMIKMDHSQAGGGTFLCRNPAQARALDKRKGLFPVLCQAFIAGRHIGFEALYDQGQLLHYTFSICLKHQNDNPFGVSSVRHYLGPEQQPPDTARQLTELGRATGLCGMVSVSAVINEDTQELCFFEADARSNAWFAHARLLGPGFAPFLARDTTAANLPVAAGGSKTYMSVPWRLTVFEFLTNRYAAWRMVLVYDLSLLDIFETFRQSVRARLLYLLRDAQRRRNQRKRARSKRKPAPAHQN